MDGELHTEFDFHVESPEQAKRFPSHGWDHNPQGLKLWFPLKILLLEIDETRSRLGAKPRTLHPVGELSPVHESELAFIPKDGTLFGVDSEVEIVGGLSSALPFYTTLNELVLILQRLHHLVGRLEAMPVPSGESESPDACRNGPEAPVLIKSVFIWLRSLLDLLAFHSRFLLFDKAGQAPEDFFKLQKAISRLHHTRWKPLVNPGKLQAIFDTSLVWMDRHTARPGRRA